MTGSGQETEKNTTARTVRVQGGVSVRGRKTACFPKTDKNSDNHSMFFLYYCLFILSDCKEGDSHA